MTTRAGIVGLGTGGLLLAVLFYPLYLMMPGLYVQGWPSGSVLISAGAVVAALALTILGGWLAAWWGGAVSIGQRAGLGALAGGVAALLVFCGLGAAAAGTFSSGFVLQSDSVFWSDTAGQAVLLEAIHRNVLWTQRMFWGMWLPGLVLGAVGGWCCPPRPAPSGQPLYNRAHPQMALNVSITTVPAAAFTVILSAALFLRVSAVIQKIMPLYSTPLYPTPAQGVVPQGLVPLAAPVSIVNGPLATSVLLYLAAHAALMLVTPHEASQADHQSGLAEVKMAAYVGIAAPLVLGVGLLFVQPQLVLRPAVLVSWLISLGMSARLVWVLRNVILPRRAQLPPPPNVQQAILFGSIAKSRWQNLLLLCIGCGLALAFPINVAVVSAALNLWLIPIQRMVLGLPEPAAELVQHLYRAQAMVSLGSMAGAGAILTGLYLFYAALGRGFQRLSSARD